MNVHHLELFYYVARHGGISEAVRNMPYGIQQPAVSAQVLQLEASLGATLFHRRPFALTPAGERLYAFVQPFFQNLDAVAGEIRGGAAQLLRVGASEVVLRDHLPSIIQSVRKDFPALKVRLREGYQPTLEGLMQKQELDVAITVLDEKAPTGINTMALIQIPLALLVPKKSKVKAAEELWGNEKIEEPLICLPPNEAMCKNFQKGLAKLNVDWLPSVEVSSLQLVETYVANGYGYGLSLNVPGSKVPAETRRLPLPDFTPIQVGFLWQGKLSALSQAFLEAVKARARFLLDNLETTPK